VVPDFQDSEEVSVADGLPVLGNMSADKLGKVFSEVGV
jgi:hypothetical protein